MRHGKVGPPGASQWHLRFCIDVNGRTLLFALLAREEIFAKHFTSDEKNVCQSSIRCHFGGSWWRDDVVKSVFAYSLIRMHYSQWGDVFADFSSCVAASETICIPKDTWCQGVPIGCKKWRHPCLVTSQYPVLWFKTDILTPCSLNTVEYLRLKWTSNYTYSTGLLV